MGRHFVFSPICLLLVCSLPLNSLSAAVAFHHRPSRSVSGSLPSKAGRSDPVSGPGTCRCVPDQWEAVMRSVERDVDLQAAVTSLLPVSGPGFPAEFHRVDSPSSSSSASEEMEVEDQGMTGAEWGTTLGLAGHEDRDHRGPEVDLRSAADFTASEESTTSIYYDYTGGRLALVEHHQRGGSVRRSRTISDHRAGVRYDISPDGECRAHVIRQNMNRMCLPEGVTLTGKFTLGADLQVALWSATGPNNSTLRTAVDRRRCIPIYEETFSLEPDYMSLKTTFYTNTRLGIKDWSVFTVPATCRLNDEEDGPTSDAKRRQ